MLKGLPTGGPFRPSKKGEFLRHYSKVAQSTYSVYASIAVFGNSLTFTFFARSDSLFDKLRDQLVSF